MRAVERCTSIRDRAIALLLFYTALRVGECASLERLNSNKITKCDIEIRAARTFAAGSRLQFMSRLAPPRLCLIRFPAG